MFRLFKLKRDEKGQSLVEFALILPILVLILLGIIEFGWLFNGKITLTSAADSVKYLMKRRKTMNG